MKKILLLSCLLLNFSMISPAMAQGETDPVSPTSPQTPSTTTTSSESNSEAPDDEVQRRTGPEEVYSGAFFRTDESDRYKLQGVIEVLLPGLARWIAGFLAALAVIFLIYAGILFLTAGGEEEKISEAIKTAVYALLGLILTMFAYVLVYLFLTLFNPS